MSEPLFSSTPRENSINSLLSCSPVLSLKSRRQSQATEGFQNEKRSPVLKSSVKLLSSTPDIGEFSSPFDALQSPFKSPVLKKIKIEPLLNTDINFNTSSSNAVEDDSYEIVTSSPPPVSAANESTLVCSEYSTDSESRESELSINDEDDEREIVLSPVISIRTCTQISSLPGSVGSVQSPQNSRENSTIFNEPLPATSKKKKKHYIKDGLARKAEKCYKRQRTESRVWRHELSRSVTSSDTDSDSTLCLSIVSIRKSFSVLFVECRVLSGIVDSDSVTVTFREEGSLDLNLVPGNQLLVNPPWQLIDSANRKILMGPNLFRIIECRPEPKTPEKYCGKSEVIQKWKCPCSSSNTTAPRSCPAQTELWAFKNLKKSTQPS